MNDKSAFRLTPQLVLGFIIVIVGTLFTLDNLDVMDARDVLRYWPAFLILYGGMKLMRPETQGSRLWGAVLAFVGFALLFDRLNIFEFRLWDFWPLILVVLGGMIIYRASSRTRAAAGGDVPGGQPAGKSTTINAGGRPADKSTTINAAAILGGAKRNVHTDDFRGGEATAIMGGVDIDLRNSRIGGNPAILDVFAFWGGIEIKVPTTWNVSFEGTPILGGFDDKTFRQASEGSQRLIIRGNIIMGGVEVSN